MATDIPTAEIVATSGAPLADLPTTFRAPEQVLADAKRAATALLDVVRQTKASVKLGKSEHLKFEAWSVCGRFYGVTARIVETRYVTFDGVSGFEAVAEAVDSTGRVLSRADSMCLNDEERWNERPVYDWQDGRRVQTGVEPVPLFQLRSMAQTRACSKVLRQLFSWVVVLAGFSATPAEEMTGKERGSAPAQDAPAQDAPAKQERPAFKEPKGDGVLGSTFIVKESVLHKQGTFKKGKNAGQAWRSFRVSTEDGTTFFTFDADKANAALELVGAAAVIKWHKDDQGYYSLDGIDAGATPPPAKAASAPVDEEDDGLDGFMA